MDFQWYTTIAGIMTATAVGVQVAKRWLGNTDPFARIPTWLYSVAIAAALTAVSKASGLLTDQGTWLEVMMKSVMLAASTSGFVSWLQHATTPIEESQPAKEAAAKMGRAAIILLAVGIGLSGTACAARGGANGEPTSPERTLATYGRQVIAVARTIVKSVDLLTQQRLAAIADKAAAKQIDAKTAHEQSEKVRADARTAAGILENIGAGGVQLANALTIVDTARTAADRDRGLQTAQSVVVSIQALVKSGVLELKDDGTRNSVVTLLAQVVDILAALQQVIPAAAAPATPPAAPALDPTPDLELDARPLLERARYDLELGDPTPRWLTPADCYFTMLHGRLIDVSPGCRQAAPGGRLAA